jgi:L-seryl-tRNA(Ser) seleniumtransferase
MVGGGSLPDQSLPTRIVAIKPPIAVEELALRLRRAVPPLLGRIEAGRLTVDPRTILPSQDSQVIAAIKAALA